MNKAELFHGNDDQFERNVMDDHPYTGDDNT